MNSLRLITYFLLVFALKTCRAGFCAHFCIVPFRLTMKTVLASSKDWSLEMLSPLETILAKTQNLKGAKRKLSWACAAVQRYRRCLDNCSDSLHKKVVLAGMPPWETICTALTARHSGFNEFLRCFKKHSKRIRQTCLPYEIEVKEMLANASLAIKSQNYQGFSDLCRAIHSYELCYGLAERPCETEALKVWGRLQRANHQAFRQLISIDFINSRLPFDCRSPIQNALPDLDDQETSTLLRKTQPPTTTSTALRTSETVTLKMTIVTSTPPEPSFTTTTYDPILDDPIFAKFDLDSRIMRLFSPKPTTVNIFAEFRTFPDPAVTISTTASDFDSDDEVEVKFASNSSGLLELGPSAVSGLRYAVAIFCCITLSMTLVFCLFCGGSSIFSK